MTITRTWPYGTLRPVEVADIDRRGSPPIVTVVDNAGEGYILVGGIDDPEHVQIGDRGEITFTKGGPTGGYWRYQGDDQ